MTRVFSEVSSVELFTVNHQDGPLTLDQVDALLLAVKIPPRIFL